MKTKTLKALLLLTLIVYPCLNALHADDAESESEAYAPVNTRVCEYSLPPPVADQTDELEEDTLDDTHSRLALESTEISTDTIAQEEAIAKFFFPGCYQHYKHYFFGPTQYQELFLESGSYLTLENGSIWKMAEADFWRVPNWTISDRLQLIRNPNLYSPHPYRLRNVENGETIRVVVRVGPRYDSPLFCTCIELDPYVGNVWCSDGTAWWVPIPDREILDTWHPHDVVMVGVNEDAIRRECPHLLINLTNGSCCHATWLP